MPRRQLGRLTVRTRLVALLAGTAVVAAAGAFLLPRHAAAPANPVANERQARDMTEEYRLDAAARVPVGFRYAEAVHSFVACPGGYSLASRYNLMPEVTSAAAGSAIISALRTHWEQRRFRIVNDTPGLTPQLLVENPSDGFRLGISQRTARYLRLAISSPCLALRTAPVTPVLSTDLATAREAYQRYVAGRLAELAGAVATLRTAVSGRDLPAARAAWLSAQLCWDRVGAAYGSFSDFADAIDGLPQGLPGGTADEDFTGLHRIEYALWHGESGPRLKALVDRLATDVGQLRASLAEATPDQRDLPLRLHEVLEDALRFHLNGQTDFGGGAGLAETLAGVDATSALLDVFSPLLDVRRPTLVPSIRAGLDTLRQSLSSARNGNVWRSPATVDPTARRTIQAALGGVLESLAVAPGLLEVSGS